MQFQRVHVFDKHESVYQQMTRMTCYPGTERFVHGDWLDTIPQYRSAFALILSDLTSGNVPYDQRPDFYSSVSKSLQVGGLFVDKVLTLEGSRRTIAELKKKYDDLPVNLLHINRFSCEFLFCSELLDIKQVVDTTLFYTILERELCSHRLLKFLAESPKITPYDCIWFYGKGWDQISEHYFHTLEAVQAYEDEGASPYYGNLKLFFSRRK